MQHDLRTKKTLNAITDAMYSLLETRNFEKITVRDICERAQISRATFYAHFTDKYAFLNYLLTEIRKNIIKDVDEYDELEIEINQFIDANKKIITNIISCANSETMALVRDFMSSIVALIIKREIINESNPQHITLFNFAIGGLVNLLTWIVDNNFPPEVTMMNKYLYHMLEAMAIWDAEQKQDESGNHILGDRNDW